MNRYLELLKEWRGPLTEDEENWYADELDRLWWAMDKTEQDEVVRILDRQKERKPMKIIIAGLAIEAHRKSYGDPPHVTVHKLGTDSHSWLTPAEARAVSAVIEDAAKTAENDS